MRRAAIAFAGVAVVVTAAAIWLVHRPRHASTVHAVRAAAHRIVRTIHVAGHVTHRGAAVAGAEIRLRSRLGGELVARAVSGADGAFDLGAQAADRYELGAQAAELAPAKQDVGPGDPGAIRLELGDCQTKIGGVVRDAGGGVIAGATVSVDLAETTTGTDGAYALCASRGRRTIVARADGYADESVELALASDRIVRDFALGPEAIVTGTVVRADGGAPVADALVEVRGSTRTAQSGEDGRFRLGGLAAGRQRLAARADGLATAGDVEVVAQIGSDRDVTLRLTGLARVSGVVLQAAQPVAGAIVRFEDRRAGFSADATTDEHGAFAIGVTPSSLTIDVDGHACKPNTVEVRPGGASLQLEVTPLGSISGKVLRAKNPAPGAHVTFTAKTGSGRSTSADADDQGSFTLTGVGPGWGTIVAVDATGAVSSEPKLQEVADGAAIRDLTLELDRDASIAGVVVDEKGAPLGGVTVEAWRQGGGDRAVDDTGPDGTFAIRPLLGGGTYHLRAYPTAGDVRPLPDAGDPVLVDLPDGASHVNGVHMVIARAALGRIVGRVVRDDGSPIADVTVSAVYGLGLEDPDATVVTGADGTFVLEGLADGDYRVDARTPSGATARAYPSHVGTDVTLTIPADGELDGTVSGFTTSPLVSIGCMLPNVSLQAEIGPDGRFRFEALPAGRYHVIARAGGEIDQTDVDVVAGAPATVALASKGQATIHGVARDRKTGAGAEGASCRAQLAAMAIEPTAIVDATGRFDLHVPAGEPLSVICEPAHDRWTGAPAYTTLAEPLPAGGEANVELVITRRTIEGADAYAGIYPAGEGTIDVQEGSPAAEAGVQDGDRIVEVDGVAVDKAYDAVILVGDHLAGETAHLVVERGDARVPFDVTLAATRRHGP
jgi:protocatechuate 3,4-dioxygenase beta subunit